SCRNDYFHYASFFFFQAEDGIRDFHVTGVQTCALPISMPSSWGGRKDSPPRPLPVGPGFFGAGPFVHIRVPNSFVRGRPCPSCCSTRSPSSSTAKRTGT